MSAINATQSSVQVSWFQQLTSSPQAIQPTANSGPVQQSGGATPPPGGKELLQQVQNAINTAKETAEEDGDSSDLTDLIIKAIQEVLEGHSRKTDEEKPAETAESADGAGESGSESSSKVQAKPGDPKKAFAELLTSFGIDPEQFSKDFVNALHAAQQGQTETNMSFGSIRRGFLLNATV